MGLGRMGGRIPWVASEATWVKKGRLSWGENWSDVQETRMIGSERSILKGDDDGTGYRGVANKLSLLEGGQQRQSAYKSRGSP